MHTAITRISNRSRRGRAALTAALLATPAFLISRPAASQDAVRALQRYPSLRDYFPFGFWLADAPHAEELAKGLGESYETRREKIFEDFARHHLNAVIPANRAALPAYLDAAQRCGLRAATMALFLYHHMDNAGNPKGQDLAWVKEAWRGHADQLKGHPALLAYHVFDEPDPTLSPKIQEVTDLLALADPRHPALYTHQNLPLDRDNAAWGRGEWALLESLDVVLSDLYSIGPAWGRDPWMYGDVGMANFRRVNPDALQWPVLQAFSYPAAPTIPEVRVMAFHTIACGAKGVFFFTAEQAYARWINPFYPSIGNPWFAEEPLYADISRVGRHLTSAGPLLIPRRLDTTYPVRVDTPSFRATVRSGWLRQDGELTRPAIHVGAFVGDDFDVLVVHNDDPWAARQGRVTVAGRGARVYDLEALKPVRTVSKDGGVTFAIRFQPGEGRLYLVGDPPDFEAAKDSVLRHLYDHDSRMVRLDADLAARAGVAVGSARESLDEAAKAAEDQDYARAQRLAGEGRARLSQAEAEHAEYSRTATTLYQIREDLHRIDHWCEVHHDFLSGRLGDSRLPALIQQVVERSRQFAALENDLRAGRCRSAEAETLRGDLLALADQVVGYRPQPRQPRRIALLQLGDASEDGRFLHDWLAMVYQEVDVLRPAPRDGFVNAAGAHCSLGRYGLVWIHLGDPAPPVTATYCGTARVVPDALSAATSGAIRKHVDVGGGLILSGLAAALVDDLGYESIGPNELYWGPLTVPGGGPMDWENYGKSGKVLGLKPTVPDHPLFRGPRPEGFAIWDWSLSEMVGKAVWRRPAWPKKGQVLAGYYSDGATIPDQFAVVVEYTGKQGGRIVVAGDCLDPNREGAHEQGKRWGTNQDRFIQNLVEYCCR